MTKRVLVVAPHPDDEILGCGGTLMRLHQQGAEVAWLIVTGISEEHGWTAERVQQRDEEIDAGGQADGIFRGLQPYSSPLHALTRSPMQELINQFSAVFKSFEPEQLFLPNRSDAHTDHRVVYDAAAACTKWFRYPSIRRVLAYETLSETGFSIGAESVFDPNYFVDITGFLERKLQVMSVYRSELGTFPFPRSVEAIRALAAVRGAASGFVAAEAFQLLRERL